MKITIHNLSKSFNRSFDLSSPGATFGRSPENQIVLPDPSVSISLFQAAIKINDAAEIELRNLAATPILVGNQSLSVGQSLTLQSGSEFSCGDFNFKIEADNAIDATQINSTPKLAANQPFRAPTVMPMPGSDDMDYEKIAAEVSVEDHIDADSLTHFGIELGLAPVAKLENSPTLESTFDKSSEPLGEHAPSSLAFSFDDLVIAPSTLPLHEEPHSTVFEDKQEVQAVEAELAMVSSVDHLCQDATEQTPPAKVEAEVETQPLAPTQVEPQAEVVNSIFDDLFSGNGVMPIGAEVNYDVHPFEMDSATARNTANPLGELHGMALDDDLSKDPLERISRDGIEHQQRDIFHDTRPSTMLHDTEEKAHSNHSDLDHLDKILRELESLSNNK